MIMEEPKKKDPKKVAAGRARALALTPQQREAISRKAALERHGKGLARAVAEGTLALGDTTLQCAVLDDARNSRVLTQEGFLTTIGRAAKAPGGQGAAVDGGAAFLRAANLKLFISDELLASITPIEFVPLRSPGYHGRAFGYRADILPAVCWVYHDAKVAKKLLSSQRHIGDACSTLLKALTNHAIEDLVDKATGFEDMKKMAAIYKMLDACVSKDKLSYVKLFDIDFYRQIYRLNGWKFDPENNARPGVVGKWTNDIYDRIAPGFGDAVRSRVKRNEAGKPTEKMTQYMTPADGKRRLREMIEAVKALMRVNKQWSDFSGMLDIAYPHFDQVPLLPFTELPKLKKE